MAGSNLSNPAMTLAFVNLLGNRFGSAEAAKAPRRAAAATATAATSATPAASAAAATPATSAAAAAAPGYLHVAANVLLVEQMERCQTDVGDFFFAERERLSRRIVRGLPHVRGRHSRCGCAAYQRESQPGGTQRGNGSFGHTLRLRSLLHPWHRHILHSMVISVLFRVQPRDCTLGKSAPQDWLRPHIVCRFCILFGSS
jgi:hypothetical protein